MVRVDEGVVTALEERAKRIRRHVVESIFHAGSGHPGGSLSAADALTALFFHVMRHDPAKPDMPGRDHFVLSKGHAAPALYAVLAESGYFPVEDLVTLRKIDSHLQGHPDRLKTPGVEASTGSLGQGLSIACGIAAALKIDGDGGHVFTLMGDGELEEGQIWEAALFASHYGLDNLIGIVDRNRLQIDGCTEDIMCIEPLPAKWKAFLWDVIEVDGHDMRALVSALVRARDHADVPTIIVANTVKGKGVSFMENSLNFHGKAPNRTEFERAMEELA
ncbi:MAG: transketolase [Thermoplasmata archaeon]|nr:transketolase [Thermoplasmata archaeon]